MTARPPSIGDYALIGDCRSAALVAKDGAIDWLCWPDFASPSILAALLDREAGGRFTVGPTAPSHITRSYRAATAVLETRFVTAQGTLRLTDLMVLPEGEGPDILQPERELLRFVECLEGRVEVLVDFKPRPAYARRQARIAARGADGWACTCRDELYLLRSEIPLEPSGPRLSGRVTLQAGETRVLSLSYSRRDIGVLPVLGAAAARRAASTQAWWETWSARCLYEGPYLDIVLRSLITLKLLTFSLSGAVVAAPTTSLPEVIGGSRNWDYRYCWLRDASLTLRAFLATGYHAEAESYLEWLLHATRLTWPRLKVLYDVYGRTDLAERELPHLKGWRDSRPVRVGNGAVGQLQLDVYGEVILAAADYVAHGGTLDLYDRRMLRGLGRSVCALWRRPDCGIWESRQAPKHYTVSKVLCWLALDALLRLREQDQLDGPVERFRTEREAIGRVIEARGYSPRLGSYVSVLDGERVDTSLLLMALLGYRPPEDERLRGTLRLILERLDGDGLVRRSEDGLDGLPGAEGAFGACCFWVAEYLAKLGEIDRAAQLFQRLLTYANDVGLFAEEFDRSTGEPLGNFPQAFTHIGLINAAVALAEATAGREERRDGLGA